MNVDMALNKGNNNYTYIQSWHSTVLNSIRLDVHMTALNKVQSYGIGKMIHLFLKLPIVLQNFIKTKKERWKAVGMDLS